MGRFYQAAGKPFYKQFLKRFLKSVLWINAVRKTLCLNKRGENQ